MTLTQIKDLLKIKDGLDIPDPRRTLNDASRKLNYSLGAFQKRLHITLKFFYKYTLDSKARRSEGAVSTVCHSCFIGHMVGISRVVEAYKPEIRSKPVSSNDKFIFSLSSTHVYNIPIL